MAHTAIVADRIEQERRGNMYRPKMVKGMVSGTGWPIDGHTLYLTLWDYDDYRQYHLSNWEDADDEAVMKTFYQTEAESGLCMVDTLEEFETQWKSDEWESQGSFCIPLENVEILEVIYEEDKDWKPKRQQEGE